MSIGVLQRGEGENIYNSEVIPITWGRHEPLSYDFLQRDSQIRKTWDRSLEIFVTPAPNENSAADMLRLDSTFAATKSALIARDCGSFRG